METQPTLSNQCQVLNRGLHSQLKDARDELARLKKAGNWLGLLGVGF